MGIEFLKQRQDIPPPWDPSDPNNMHAISLSAVPDEWQPKIMKEDISSRYKDVIILIGAIFLAGIVAVWVLAMIKWVPLSFQHFMFRLLL